MRWLILPVLLLMAPATIARAQSQMTLQRGLDHTDRAHHRDPLGKPCLDVEAASRSHKANPNVFDHMISVVNRCGIPIRYRLCYFETQHCVEMTTLGYRRSDVILGINPGMKNFRYEIYEKF